MPFYHFDLVDHEFDLVRLKAVPDDDGTDLTDDLEAIDCADELARRLREEQPELRNRHYSLLVTNEDGEEVCRLPIDVLH